MPTTTLSTNLAIDRPLATVFAYAGNRHTRLLLLPDNFSGARVLDGPEGVGARFAFTLQTDRGAYDSITEVIAWEPPRSFTERTNDGSTEYETAWSFAPSGEGTLVTLTTRYPAPARLLDRLIERLFAHKALRTSLLAELVRLKQRLEGEPPALEDGDSATA